jgi:hypothetical protein
MSIATTIVSAVRICCAYLSDAARNPPPQRRVVLPGNMRSMSLLSVLPHQADPVRARGRNEPLPHSNPLCSGKVDAISTHTPCYSPIFRMLLILRDWATRAASRVLVLRDVVRTFAQSVYGFNALGRLKAMTLVPSIADIETAIACAKGADAMALYEAFLVTSKTGANTAEWQLLIGVFGMMLRAGNVVEPFQPIMQLADGRRTMLPADLSQAQLVAFRIVFPGPDCPSYRARIGDVLWLTERNVSAGKLAVDSYRLAGVAIGISARPIDADAHYERAARLAKQIDKRGDQLRQQLDFILGRVVS